MGEGALLAPARCEELPPELPLGVGIFAGEEVGGWRGAMGKPAKLGKPGNMGGNDMGGWPGRVG